MYRFFFIFSPQLTHHQPLNEIWWPIKKSYILWFVHAMQYILQQIHVPINKIIRNYELDFII